MQSSRLEPWSEILGTIVHIDKESLTIRTTTLFKINLPPEELDELSSKLTKGSLVGILRSDDGTIRVRNPNAGRRR